MSRKQPLTALDSAHEKRRRRRFSVWRVVAPIALVSAVFTVLSIIGSVDWSGGCATCRFSKRPF
jgi:hypothetical protein